MKTLVGAGIGWALFGPIGAIIGGVIGARMDDELKVTDGSRSGFSGGGPFGQQRQQQSHPYANNTRPGDFIPVSLLFSAISSKQTTRSVMRRYNTFVLISAVPSATLEWCRNSCTSSRIFWINRWISPRSPDK